MERYEESYDCYRALMKGHHDDYGLERQANMAAVVAMMHSIGSQKVVSTDVIVHVIDSHRFEFCHTVTWPNLRFPG